MIPPGLFLQYDFITEDTENMIVRYLDSKPWSTKLSRRTQHYGYEYNYNSRDVNNTAPSIEGILKDIADHLARNNILNPTQCIVNEYTKNQGISAHTDSNNFGPVIAGVCLNESCYMKFTNGNLEYDCWLPRRCLYIMSGESRTSWKHSISPNLTYTHNGQIMRKSDSYRRISLTYRTLA